MRIFLILCLFFWTSNAFAGFRYNSQTGAKDFCNTIRDESSDVENTRCQDLVFEDGLLSDEGGFFLLRSSSGTSTTSMTSATTTVPVAYKHVRKAIASDPAFSQGPLPDGTAGQILIIEITENYGTGTFTVTPETSTGFSTLIFEGPNDRVSLLFVDDENGWVILNNGSVQFTP